jgi:hypothetical protein
LIKDYDLGINYHPGKSNVVADALSHKKYCNATFAKRIRPELHKEIKYLHLVIANDTTVAMEVEPTLEAEIRKGQLVSHPEILISECEPFFPQET